MHCCKCEKYSWENRPEPIDKEYCLFHAPAKLKAGREDELRKAVQQRCEQAQKSPSQTCQLSGTIFTYPFTFDNIKVKRIDFRSATFEKRITFPKCDFEQNVIFDGTIFNEKVSILKTNFIDKIAISFYNCTFNGELRVQSNNNIKNIFNIAIYFDGSTFNGKVYFSNIIFKRLVSFKKTKFCKESYFEKIYFNDSVVFNGAHFLNSFKLEKSKLIGDSSFQYVTFDNYVSFLKSTFNGNTTFNGSKFKSLVTFEKALFVGGGEKNINFFNSKLCQEGKINFSVRKITTAFLANNINFEGRFILDNVHFLQKVSFRNANLGWVSFAHCVFEKAPLLDNANLSQAELAASPVEKFRFINCKWPKSNHRKVTFDARKRQTGGYFPIDDVLETASSRYKKGEACSAHELEYLYRRLKKIAQTDMNESLASDFHYAEKEMQRVVLLKKIKDNTICRKIKNLIWYYWQKMCPPTEGQEKDLITRADIHDLFVYLALTFYKWTSGYGESPGRAGGGLILTSILPLIFFLIIGWWLFPVVNNVVNAFAVPSSNIVENWLHFFPLIRLPNANDAGWFVRLIMMLWQIIITLQAALFAFALRNRFRR